MASVAVELYRAQLFESRNSRNSRFGVFVCRAVVYGPVDLTVMGTSFANIRFLLSPATLSEELINT